MNNKIITNHLTNHYSDFVFQFLLNYGKELDPKIKILDVGCGHYRNLKLFQELGFENLFGIDRNASNNPLNVQVEFIQGDIQEGLPFDDKSFDVVLCNYVLMFIKPSKIDFTLRELTRVCNSYLLVETYPKKSSGEFYEDYSFKDIATHIKNNKNFKVLKKRVYYEKLLARRVE